MAASKPSEPEEIELQLIWPLETKDHPAPKPLFALPSTRKTPQRKPEDLKFEQDMARQAMFDARSPVVGGRVDGLEFLREGMGVDGVASSWGQVWKGLTDEEARLVMYWASRRWCEETKQKLWTIDYQTYILEAF